MLGLYAGGYKYNLDVRGVSIIVQLVKFMTLVFYFYVVRNLLREEGDIRTFVFWWMISAGITGLAGIVGAMAYQFLGISSSFSSEFRAMGTFGNANMYAGHMVLSLFLSVAYLELGGRKWLFAAFVPIYLVGLLLSASKGAMLGFLIAGVAFVVIVPKYRIKSMGIIIPGIIALSVTFVLSDKGSIYIERLSQVTDRQTFSQRSRLLLWSNAVDVWGKNPLVGVGRGNFGAVSNVYDERWTILDERARLRSVEEGEEGRDNVYVHSTYLAFLCETGAIGLALFLAIIGVFMSRVFKALMSLPPDSKYYAIIASLGAALTGVLTQGIVTNVENNRGMWCIAGVVFAASEWALSKENRSQQHMEMAGMGIRRAGV
jgi:O-antigen ligase